MNAATTNPRVALPVVETFHSLQGEGLHSGRSAFFIRLAGCSVGCRWCDTKNSWPRSAHPEMTLEELNKDTRQAGETGAAFVVITGGEPLEHNLAALCDALKPTGLPLHLETSGVGELSGSFDWITLSPKPHRPPLPSLLSACQELKVVVHESSDLTFAETMAAAAALERGENEQPPHLLMQPGWGCPAGLQLAMDYVLTHANWRISPQTHKWLGAR